MPREARRSDVPPEIERWERREFTIRKQYPERRRLDVHLTHIFPEHSRALLQNLIREGRVRVNGRAPKTSTEVHADDAIEIEIPVFKPFKPKAEEIPVEVLHEDEWLVAIQKPAGMVVHPAKGHWKGTLVNAILHRWGALTDIAGHERPGIVHRLDQDTSGVIPIAKELRTQSDLGMLFELRKIRKTYLAIVHGTPSPTEGEITLPIGRNRREREKMAVRHDNGQRALTDYRLEEALGPCSLVACFPRTGRTHQIRVHLSAIGHPILADETYGGRPLVTSEGAVLLERQALHAHKIAFVHPRTKAPIEITAPLPEDLARACEALRDGTAAPSDADG